MMLQKATQIGLEQFPSGQERLRLATATATAESWARRAANAFDAERARWTRQVTAAPR